MNERKPTLHIAKRSQRLGKPGYSKRESTCMLYVVQRHQRLGKLG